MNSWLLNNQSDTSLLFAISFRQIGNGFLGLKQKDSAIYYYQSSLEALKKQNRKDNINYVHSLSNIGLVYDQSKDYASASDYFNQAKELRKKLYGELHPDYSKDLFNLAKAHLNNRDFQNAELKFKELLEIKKKVVGEEHTDYADCLYYLGLTYLKSDRFKDAERCYRKNVLINKNTSGEYHVRHGGSITELGTLFHYTAQYDSALVYYAQALRIAEKIYGIQDEAYASALNNIAVIKFEKGDYESAEKMNKEAIEIKRKTLGEQHHYYATSLFNLGNLYYFISDYKSAEFYFKKSLEIRKRSIGEKHPDYAINIVALGMTSAALNDSAKADFYYKEALDLYKIIFGEEHSEFARLLNNIGVFYTDTKKYDDAEIVFKKALQIWKKVLEGKDSKYSNCMGNLASILSSKGEHQAALMYNEKALEILDKNYGKEFLEYIGLEINHALYLGRIQKEKEGLEIFERNLEKKSRLITNNFQWLSENQQEAYWTQENNFFTRLFTYVHRYHGKLPEAAGISYDALLYSKSRLLENKILKGGVLGMDSSNNPVENPEFNELRNELVYKTRLLYKLESDGSDKTQLIDQLRREKDSLDKRMTTLWPDYARQKKNLRVTYRDIQQQLNSGDAAIEFVRSKEESDSVYYYHALILRKEDPYPLWVTLCKESELQKIKIGQGFSNYYPLLWQPMEPYLKDIHTIYYAPTGELNHVPFHALYVSKGQGDLVSTSKKVIRGKTFKQEQVQAEGNSEYLMDRYTLHQLTSTRSLALGLKEKAETPITPGIHIVGGVNYDYLPSSSELNKNEKKGKNGKRNAETESVGLSYLDGSQTEAENILKITSSNNWPSQAFFFNDATEENIIKLEGKSASSVLHLATHGFAFPEYNFRDSISKNSIRYNYRYNKDPMVRCGLILSGGNWAWTGNDTLSKLGSQQNGILTALEVSQMDLKNTKLVVLSACETGLGTVEGTEGTFGLKRGFKLAGVEQMIVSLWSVPDQETNELMTLFYTELASTLRPVASFEKAQMQMRKKYPTRPDLWAGFVLVR